MELLERAKRTAESPATALIRGESGVGKALLASLLHHLGPSCDEPLVVIDCTKPSALLEAELFGCEQDGLNGGLQSRRGRLELAGNGTVVLDEIAAIAMPLQSKLLRVIEEKRFQRPGGARVVSTEARIVALTSIDLERAVARRSFREDLYYRLNIAPLLVPPLRERPRDIGPLSHYFLQQLSEIHRKPPASLLPDALEALERHSYPGNVRELRDVVERALVYASTPELTLQDLPPHLQSQRSTNGHKKSLEELEREYIIEVLGHTGGKKTKAAAILGISRKTLLEKRKRYGLG